MTPGIRMKTVFSTRPASRAWSSAELQQLRALAHETMPIEAIAARLRRSVSAIRNKAGMHGISLASTPRRVTDAPPRPVATKQESRQRSQAATVPGYTDI
jgi:hypothetical protein